MGIYNPIYECFFLIVLCQFFVFTLIIENI